VNQVQELEQAILARAGQLAAQFADQAQRTRESILREAAERLRQREQREETIARALGERRYRQRIQAAELKLQSQLDRVRWNLVRGVEGRLEERMRNIMSDDSAYLEYLRGLVLHGAEAFESDTLVVRTNAADHRRLSAHWAELQQAIPGTRLRLDDETIETLGGVLLQSEDGRIRVNNTFEGRMARLRLRLQQVILERLLPATPDAANFFSG
jgi:V/A-type H+/Na+-transporting ATPase subunit E